MARYWLNDISNIKTCPYDHHPLKLIKYQCTGMAATTALTCDFCDGIFLRYISAEVATTQPNISDSYLSGREKQELKALRRKQAEEKEKALAVQKKIEQDRLMKARKEQEALKRAEQAALKAKRDCFITKINSVFESDYLSSELFFQLNNKEHLLSPTEFNQLQAEFVKNWFIKNSSTNDCFHDKEQCASIGATRKNVEVIARAGSGKTATIINRFRFLTEHCGVDASTMLLLAFNRKAAEELREKIDKLLQIHPERSVQRPHVMTFHALAYSIVHPMEKLIYDDDDTGSRELSRTVQSIIDLRLCEVSWVSKIKTVMLSHFKGNWEAIEATGHNLTKKEMLLYRRSLPNQTLKGEYVKSFGEKAIANILFEHAIKYEYEKAFRWTDGTPYRPDFTVCGSNNRQIFIEYFGLAGTPEYDRQIQRKRNFCASKRIHLIEVYPKDIADGLDTLTSKLLRLLEKNGVPYRKLSEDEIWEKIKDRAIDAFTSAITSFIGRCRKKDLSASNLRELVKGYTSHLETENMFLEIACDIFDEYLRKVRQEHLEDFDGLISRAIACVREGKTGFDKWDNRGDLNKLSFIMIDEYQDFSYLFDGFLKAVCSVCPDAGLFCVGDDWQAINAFAGSDVKYFQQFTRLYSDSIRYYLETNYRSKKEIVFAGTHLMSEVNGSHPIKAAKVGNGVVRLGYLTEFTSSPVEQSLHGTDTLTPAVLRLVSSILEQKKRVVFLTRTNERLPMGFTCRVKAAGTYQEHFLSSIRSFFTSDQRKMITASTTHKYKGKEEDVVIILDAVVGYYPLIHPAWIFQRVLGDTLEKLINEEKRLFYVAVSRSKEDLYILTTKGDESPFLAELGHLDRLRWDDYAPLRTDEVSIKIEVYNQPGYGFNPTIVIKEQLKANLFRWDGTKNTWYHYYSRKNFDIMAIINQSWTQLADHVILAQFDEDNKPEDAYLFANGSIIRLPVKDERL